MSDSSLKVQESQDVTIVGFKDRSILDALTIQKIGRELYDLVDVQGKKMVVLDFAEVRFLSSQALGVLLTLRRKADKVGAKVMLCSIRAELVRVFKITNLDKLFQFFETLDSAMKALGRQPLPSGTEQKPV